MRFCLALVLAVAACVDAPNTTTDDGEASAPGSFELWQSADGWHFHLAGGNGSILLASEAYSSRVGALAGVLSVVRNGADASHYSIEPAAHGYLLHLVAGNNEVIGFSESYASRSNATRAVDACVRAVTSYDDVRAAHTGARAEVEQGETGEYYVHLFARNGEEILGSHGYSTEASAWNGAFAMQDAAARGDVAFAVKTGEHGRYYFTLSAANAQVLGTSQSYASRGGVDTGIASVKTTLAQLDLL